MKIHLMRLLDRYAGKTIIIFLIICVHFRSLFSAKESSTIPNCPNIVIQKFFGLGSIANSFPLIEVIKKEIPNCKITYLTFAGNKELLDIAGVSDEVLTIRSRQLQLFTLDCIKCLYKLRRSGVHAYIDLEFFSRFSMIMSYLSGARIRVGFFSHFNIRSELLTHPVTLNHYKHISRCFLAMAEVLGIQIEDAHHNFSLPSQNVQIQNKLDKLLGDFSKKELIVFNPNASTLCSLRRWPSERFSKLADLLAEKKPDSIFALIGTKEEEHIVADVISNSTSKHKMINLAGKTDLRTLLALFERAKILVSNDSGPVHLAAGYQTPTLVLFGPETPVMYKPLNDDLEVLYKGLYCSPCINVLDNKQFEDCTNIECMQGISVKEAFQAAVRLLKVKD